MDRKACDECRGKLAQKKVPYELYGVKLGDFPAEVCQKCGEVVFLEETSRAMTAKAKELGLFGLEARTKVGVVGDSLDVRIPKRVAEFLGISKGTEVWLHPEKNKLIVETRGIPPL